MTREILDEKKGKEIKLCENNINIELNLESIILSIFIAYRTK